MAVKHQIDADAEDQNRTDVGKVVQHTVRDHRAENCRKKRHGSLNKRNRVAEKVQPLPIVAAITITVIIFMTAFANKIEWSP